MPVWGVPIASGRSKPCCSPTGSASKLWDTSGMLAERQIRPKKVAVAFDYLLQFVTTP
jgi:hypothetical protein